VGGEGNAVRGHISQSTFHSRSKLCNLSRAVDLRIHCCVESTKKRLGDQTIKQTGLESDRPSGSAPNSVNNLLKNCVFWDVTPCGSCKNLHFGGT
jgi:hypothetical protein